MALKAIKGITVEIGGDTVGLQKALNEVDKSSKILNSELRQVNNALKFDPANTTLLAQKQQILSEQIRNTSLKLQQLKSVQEQVEQKYKKGDIGADAYRAFQRVLIETENRLESMKNEQEELNEATEETEEETEEAEKKTKNYGKALEGLVNAAVNAGQAILDVAKAAGEMAIKGIQASTEVGKSFESSVSQIAATMGKTTDEISDLTDKAKEMGATTQFSATEAAQGLNILAMSGLKTEEQIAGIEKVLNLAAAGGLTLESAASYTTGTVKGFGDTMENAQYYTDLMAKGATLANTNVNDLGAALSRTAANANSYGQTADGVTLSLLRLAEQNVTGENAATQLNRAMADLYTPTDTAKQALQELGIAAYDSQGNTRDFNVVVDELNAKLSTMTDEQANAYKNTIFTTNGLNAFNKMTASSTEKVELFKEELAKASEGEGSAAEQAKTMIDNLEGDITIMQSAAEGLGITFYETFNKDLRENVQFATDSLGQLTEAFKNGGIEEAANVAGGILADISNKAAEYAPMLINTASTLINSVANALTENAPNIAQSAGEIVKSIANGLTSNTQTILKAVLEIGDTLLDTMPNVLRGLIHSTSSFSRTIINFFSNSISVVAESLPEIISVLRTTIGGQLPLLTQSIFDLITNTVDSVLELLPQILPDIINLAISLITHLIPQLIDTTLQIAQSIVDNVPQILNVLVAALPNLIQGISTALLNQLPKIIDSVIALVTSLVDSLPSVIHTLIEAIPPIISAIIGAVSASLPKIITAVLNLVTKIIVEVPKIINMILDALPEIVDAVIDGVAASLPQILDCIIQMVFAIAENLPDIVYAIIEIFPQIFGSFIKAAIELTPMLLGAVGDIIWGIVNYMNTQGVETLKEMSAKVGQSIIDKFNGFVSDFTNIGWNLITGIWDGIYNAKDWIVDKINGWCGTVVDTFTGFFGIHSPSTLFRDTIGENLALGIGVGFSDTMTDVTKNMQNALPTSFDIDPDVNITSGDMRMQTLPQSTSIVSAVQSGMGAVNFTLNIENFNNADSSALINLSDTITYTLYELIYRQKAVTA